MRWTQRYLNSGPILSAPAQFITGKKRTKVPFSASPSFHCAALFLKPYDGARVALALRPEPIGVAVRIGATAGHHDEPRTDGPREVVCTGGLTAVCAP